MYDTIMEKTINDLNGCPKEIKKKDLEILLQWKVQKKKEKKNESIFEFPSSPIMESFYNDQNSIGGPLAIYIPLLFANWDQFASL